MFIRGCSSVSVRALACQARGREFKSRHSRHTKNKGLGDISKPFLIALFFNSKSNLKRSQPKGSAPENMAAIGYVALNLLRKNKTFKCKHSGYPTHF